MGPRGSQPKAPGGPEPQKPPAQLNIYTCIVYHACAGPFWRMRQSILANAPIYLIHIGNPISAGYWKLLEIGNPGLALAHNIGNPIRTWTSKAEANQVRVNPLLPILEVEKQPNAWKKVIVEMS